MSRTISVSEAGTLECEHKHALSYTGRLTDDTVLKRKNPALTLRRGRAWGAGVQALHQTGSPGRGHIAINDAVTADAEQLQAHGCYDPEEHETLLYDLHAILEHYFGSSPRLELVDCEVELRVPIPSRTGRRRSSKYVFHGFIDGIARTDAGLVIVEYKLRDSLTKYEDAVHLRQPRWYAWAAGQQLGEPIAGVIIDERLNAPPKAPRILKNGSVSAAKDQRCTPEAYVSACRVGEQDVDQDTLDALRARDWQRRHHVLYSRSEIADVGDQLVSVAQHIADLDQGHRVPVRNPSPLRCNGCSFRRICTRLDDREVIDLDYERHTPKRLLHNEEDAPQ